MGKTKRGKGTKLMAVADGAGLPIAISVGSASPHEVKLVETTLKQRFIKEKPERLIGDRAYDSDPLDARLRRQGIEMIAPHKINRRKPGTQVAEPCAVIKTAGRLSDCSLGCKTFVGFRFVMIEFLKIISALSC